MGIAMGARGGLVTALLLGLGLGSRSLLPVEATTEAAQPGADGPRVATDHPGPVGIWELWEELVTALLWTGERGS